MAELMPQFDFTTFPSQVFWLVAVFAVQYFVIAKLVMPRFKALFNKREDYLDQQLKQAEKCSRKAEELRIDYEQKLEEIKYKNEELVNQTSAKIELEAEEKLSNLEKQFAEEATKHEEKFKEITHNMDVVLNEITLDLAVNILDKLTQTKVNKKKLAKYIN